MPGSFTGSAGSSWPARGDGPALVVALSGRPARASGRTGGIALGRAPRAAPLEHDRQQAQPEHEQREDQRDREARRRQQQHQRAEHPEPDIDPCDIAAPARLAATGA